MLSKLLLGLVEQQQRVNKGNGILETCKRRYKHLEKLLKPIPLNTPTELTLRPGRNIIFTLLDANHCPGAVMFLIQDEIRNVLYTGDIRAEKWWIDTLTRHPAIIPFSHGLKRMDKIYLDTTFASTVEKHLHFPPKADGVAELLREIASYPPDTFFYFRAWCSGFEEVWLAIAQMFRSQIHVTEYTYELYKQLAPHNSAIGMSPEGPSLAGSKLGNHPNPGCLTSNRDVRFHSCEPGSGCPVPTSEDTVVILPILSRCAGGEIAYEPGVTFTAPHRETINIDLSDNDIQLNLRNAISLNAVSKWSSEDKLHPALVDILEAGELRVPIDLVDGIAKSNGIDLDRLLSRIVSFTTTTTTPRVSLSIPHHKSFMDTFTRIAQHGGANQQQRRRLTFPYARHSSYEELCDLVGALRPLDVYPCTFHEHAWSEDTSIRELFGKCCFGNTFTYDEKVSLKRQSEQARIENSRSDEVVQRTRSDMRTNEHNETGRRKRWQDETFITDPTNLITTKYAISSRGSPKRARRESVARSTHLSSSQGTQVSMLELKQPEAVDGLRTYLQDYLSTPSLPARHKDELRDIEPSIPPPMELRECSRRTLGSDTNNTSNRFLVGDQESCNNEDPIHSVTSEPIGSPTAYWSPEDQKESPVEGTQIRLSEPAFESQNSAQVLPTSPGVISRRKDAFEYAKQLMGSSIELEKNPLISAGGDHAQAEFEL